MCKFILAKYLMKMNIKINELYQYIALLTFYLFFVCSTNILCEFDSLLNHFLFDKLCPI